MSRHHHPHHPHHHGYHSHGHPHHRPHHRPGIDPMRMWQDMWYAAMSAYQPMMGAYQPMLDMFMRMYSMPFGGGGHNPWGPHAGPHHGPTDPYHHHHEAHPHHDKPHHGHEHHAHEHHGHEHHGHPHAHPHPPHTDDGPYYEPCHDDDDGPVEIVVTAPDHTVRVDLSLFEPRRTDDLQVATLQRQGSRHTLGESDVRFDDEGPATKLLVDVPGDKPSGMYTGVVFDRCDHVPRGTLQIVLEKRH